MMFKDFKELMTNIQGNRNIITEYVNNQNKRYAYQVKAPAYHKNINCQWMNKSFNNIQIPQNSLSDIHTEQKVKEWISANKKLAFEELNQKFKIEFNCKEGLEKISRVNSGSTDFENDNLEKTFQQEIKIKYKQLKFFLDGELTKKVANFRYAPSFKIKEILRNNKDEKAHQTILNFHSIKDAIKKIIFDFYKSKYNEDLSFEDTILDSIGFSKCRTDECK
jgi:RecG-like helicase